MRRHHCGDWGDLDALPVPRPLSQPIAAPATNGLTRPTLYFRMVWSRSSVHPNLLAVLWALTLASPLAAQEETLADLLDDPAIQLSRPADRGRVVARMAELEDARRQNARTRATLLGLPLRTVLPNGRVQEIVDFDGDRPRLFHHP